jgi:hypothetical protein
MRLFLDIDTREFLQSPAFPRAITTLSLKRRDTDLIELQFLRDRTVQELPAGTAIRLGIKPAASYTAEFLATGTFTKSGTGTATSYLLDLNLNTVPLNTVFEVVTPEPETLAAMLEIEWASGTNTSSSLTLPIVIANDVIRGDEGDPAELPLFYTSSTPNFLATQAEAEAGSDNTKWMSPLRTAQAIAALTEDGVSSWNDLTDKPLTFAPSTHTHAIADTTGLQTALDGKSATSHTHALSALTQSSATTGQVVTFNGTAWVPEDPSGGGGVTSYNDLTDVPTTFSPATHNHSAAEITSGTLALARIPTGTTSTTVCIGNDSRLSDARTPTTHSHGNITNAGAIGTSSGVPIITGTSGVLQAGSFGATAGTFCQGNDSRLLTLTGGLTAIAVVSAMPATPNANTLYIVTE